MRQKPVPPDSDGWGAEQQMQRAASANSQFVDFFERSSAAAAYDGRAITAYQRIFNFDFAQRAVV